MKIQKLTLDAKGLDEGGLCTATLNNDEAVACLLTMAIVIPVGSLLVSGSIVLVGNSLHWLEYQGRCDESFLKEQVSRLKTQPTE